MGNGKKKLNFSRIERLVRMLGLLQSGRPRNVDSLAQECGVTRRTVFRDLETLALLRLGPAVRRAPARLRTAAGELPAADQFHAGGSALALVVVGHEMGRRFSLPFYEAARRATVKLESGLPSRLRQELRSIVGAVHVQTRAGQPARRQKGRPTSGCWSASADGAAPASPTRPRPTTRRFKPSSARTNCCSAAAVGTSWAGRRCTRRSGRSISAASHRWKNSRETFKVPRGFSIEKHLRNAWHMIPESGPDRKVVIRFGPAGRPKRGGSRLAQNAEDQTAARRFVAVRGAGLRAVGDLPGGSWATAIRRKCFNQEPSARWSPGGRPRRRPAMLKRRPVRPSVRTKAHPSRRTGRRRRRRTDRRRPAGRPQAERRPGARPVRVVRRGRRQTDQRQREPRRRAPLAGRRRGAANGLPAGAAAGAAPNGSPSAGARSSAGCRRAAERVAAGGSGGRRAAAKGISTSRRGRGSSTAEGIAAAGRGRSHWFVGVVERVAGVVVPTDQCIAHTTDDRAHSRRHAAGPPGPRRRTGRRPQVQPARLVLLHRTDRRPLVLPVLRPRNGSTSGWCGWRSAA